tara:strand:- start:11 stop:514 length:504 start_codon:yes stop_codon:yes gene_type:complete
MQKLLSAVIGQNVTELYPHPKCSSIAADPNGSVYTLWTKGAGSRRPQLTESNWRLITTYCGAKFRPNQSIALPKPVCEELGVKGFRVLSGRFNLECYLGRTLQRWEVCRHGDLGNCDHSLANLSPGCQLNNIIDDVESGRIKTTPEQLRIAIDRLSCLLNSTKPTNQ